MTNSHVHHPRLSCGLHLLLDNSSLPCSLPRTIFTEIIPYSSAGSTPGSSISVNNVISVNLIITARNSSSPNPILAHHNVQFISCSTVRRKFNNYSCFAEEGKRYLCELKIYLEILTDLSNLELNNYF